ncbi:hypothetical protein C8J57DRAFT_1681159 [Mycena rebaudengoi]|nr:hypothetical protein C8J57DRAFT_1681159 [Mycena rebaudengoi]
MPCRVTACHTHAGLDDFGWTSFDFNGSAQNGDPDRLENLGGIHAFSNHANGGTTSSLTSCSSARFANVHNGWGWKQQWGIPCWGLHPTRRSKSAHERAQLQRVARQRAAALTHRRDDVPRAKLPYLRSTLRPCFRSSIASLLRAHPSYRPLVAHGRLSTLGVPSLLRRSLLPSPPTPSSPSHSPSLLPSLPHPFNLVYPIPSPPLLPPTPPHPLFTLTPTLLFSPAPDLPPDTPAYLAACSGVSNATWARSSRPARHEREGEHEAELPPSPPLPVYPPILLLFLTSLVFRRIEIRVKLPTGDWLWRALWMLPADDVYGGWPFSGES